MLSPALLKYIIGAVILVICLVLSAATSVDGMIDNVGFLAAGYLFGSAGTTK
jgi:hypothetical protein